MVSLVMWDGIRLTNGRHHCPILNRNKKVLFIYVFTTGFTCETAYHSRTSEWVHSAYHSRTSEWVHSAYHSRTSEWVHSAYHSRTSEWVHSQFLVGFLLLRFFLYSSLWTIIYLLFFYYLAILLSILYLRLLDYLFGIFKHFFRSKLFFLLVFISICLVVFAYFKCLYIVWWS